MKAMKIAGANTNFGPPQGWDESRDGPCHVLPVRRTLSVDGGTVDTCESAWFPSDDDLALLEGGGAIILRIKGWQPPVALYVEPYNSKNKNA